MDDDSKRVDELLDAWDEVRTHHPRLQQRVWARIANQDSEAPSVPDFLHLAHSLLSRPAYASAFVIACVLLGLLLAEVRVANQQVKRSTQLAESYKQVIDPLFRDAHLLE